MRLIFKNVQFFINISKKKSFTDACYPVKIKMGKEMKDGSLVLNVIHGKEMEIEYIKNSEEIISKVDLEILRSKLKAALYSSQPKYIPNVECKFCQCLKGCKKGQEYLKLNQ